MKLENKVAIVTGAASGLGRAIADTFIAEGAKVIYTDIQASVPDLKLDGDKSYYFQCDVSKPESVADLIREADKLFGRLDIMVNNAGIGDSNGLLDTTNETWAKILGINLFGVFYGARAAGQYMKEKGIKGSIINTSSILGTVGLPGAVSYCTAKGGVVQLTHAGALDLAPFGIRMNAVAPGFIATNMTKGVLMNNDFKTLVETNTPLGHVGEPNDIAQAVLYLASEDSKYVTGTILHVDGGWTAR